jgi:hypothetical protein
VTGNTPDISEWIKYDWYQPVFYHDTGAFPVNSPEQAGRWLGVSHRIGQALCYWIMPESGEPITWTTVHPWTDDELQNPGKIQALSEYNQINKERIDGDDPVQVPGLLDPTNQIIDVYDGADDIPDPMEPEAVQDEADDYTDEAYDQLISIQVMLPQGEGLV